MTIEKQQFLYEALIRFGPDGYEGSHQIWMDRYVDTDTGVVVSEQQRAAEPLAEEAIAELVGRQVGVMAMQITELRSQLENKTAQIAELEQLHG